MKIILISNCITRITDPLVNYKHTVVGIIESAPRNYKRKNPKYLISTIKRIYRTIKSKNFTLKDYASKKNIPYKFMTSSDDKSLEDWIQSKNVDLIVVYSMSRLLKKNIFSIPKFGTINLHPSYLPDYRGANPCFWQYYYQETNPGVTVHFIDEGEDTGNIILQERKKIPLGIKSSDRLDILIGDLGTSLLLRSIDLIEQKSFKAKKQPKSSPTLKARNLKLEEHSKIINWEEWSTPRIWNLLRGTETWLNALPQPSGIFKGQRWVIGKYELDKINQPSKPSPGRVFRRRFKYFLSTSDGKITLSIKFNFKDLILSVLDGQ